MRKPCRRQRCGSPASVAPGDVLGEQLDQLYERIESKLRASKQALQVEITALEKRLDQQRKPLASDGAAVIDQPPSPMRRVN